MDATIVQRITGLEIFQAPAEKRGQTPAEAHEPSDRESPGLAAFGLEKIDLLRVNGTAPPVLQMQQDAVFEEDQEFSVRLPVV